MKIKSVIIDDEDSNRDVLKSLLVRFCPDVVNIGEAASIKQGYEIIIDKKPDLVFLDIQMPNGNGFSLLKMFEQIPFQIIFVTSFDQYAINAIKYSALDYLLKPVEVSGLVGATNKALAMVAQKYNQTEQVIHLLSNSGESEIERSLAIHDRGNVRFVKVSEIISIEASVNYSILTLVSCEKIVTTRILKNLEEVLEENKLFLRINKSSLINLNYIRAYSKKEPYTISLTDGRLFEISRRKKQEVNERLNAK